MDDLHQRIEELEEAHRQRERAGQAIRRILEAVPGGIVHVGADGAILHANAHAQRFLGLTWDTLTRRFSHDFAGRTWWEDGTPCLPEAYPVSLCLATGEPSGPATLGVEQPSGEVRWAVFRAIPVPVGDDTGAVVTFVDITDRKAAEDDRKRMQERLQLTDRLASLGTLAAGVAHEVNNPLTYVLGNLVRLVGMLPEGSEPRRLAEQAWEGADRVRDIVRNLSRFSRWEVDEIGPFDVHRALEAAIAMAQVELRHRARLERHFEPVPAVDGNEGGAVQVFLNLLVNASQAIPAGRVPDNRIEVHTRVERGAVVVEIRDTGAGMDEEHLKRAFDPFFTTKPVGEGTGLGLSISHAIVLSMGGTLDLVSVPGEGTTARVALPVATTARPQAPPSAPTPPPAEPRIRILVVDDEPDIREILEWFLDGWAVDQAENGLQAWVRCQEESYDVILCDLMMPELTGMDLYERLRSLGLEERVVFMTGGAYTARARSFLDAVPNPVIGKPFHRDAVRRLVSGVLQRSVT